MAELAKVMCKVVDSSATMNFPKRVHDIIMNGEVKRIEFTYGKPTELPFEEAAKFQRQGFTVYNADGSILKPPSEVPPAIQLGIKVNECVARLEELTQDALYLRAASLIGGEKFTRGATKKDLVKFLINYNEKANAKAELNAPNSAEILAEMSDEDFMKTPIIEDDEFDGTKKAA